MSRYAMVIDTKRCFGCQTCAVACKTANNLPKGVRWNKIATSGSTEVDCGSGEFPNISMTYLPMACQHCANPSCVSVCPTGASYVNSDGIVLINSDECIGCKACLAACPYDARTFIEDPSWYLDFSTGDGMEPQHDAGVVEKCNFCWQRIEAGKVPACMELCPGSARTWGDLDDPESDASKALAGRETMRYREEDSTEPSTIYLI